jgi:hypothetical protein
VIPSRIRACDREIKNTSYVVNHHVATLGSAFLNISEPTPSNAERQFPVDRFAVNRVRNSVEGTDLVTAAVKDLRLQKEMNDFLDGLPKAS